MAFGDARDKNKEQLKEQAVRAYGEEASDNDIFAIALLAGAGMDMRSVPAEPKKLSRRASLVHGDS